MDVDVTHGRRRADRDHDLLDALRRGDRTAPDELMTRYRRRAIRLASGITGNHQDAEDVVQDACHRRASRDEASLDDIVPGPVRDWPAAADDPFLRAELRCALAAAMDELTAELVKGRAYRARQFLRRRLACKS